LQGLTRRRARAEVPLDLRRAQRFPFVGRILPRSQTTTACRAISS